MELEKEFEFKIKIVSYMRNTTTKKITQVTYSIEGKGLKNADGDYISGIQRTFSVDIPDDMPDNTIKHEELSKDLMHYWVNTLVDEKTMNDNIKSVYSTMYPEVEYFYPKFQY